MPKVLINNGKSNDDIARNHFGSEKKKKQRQTRNKPKIKLTPLENIAVNAKTQQEYNTLMQVYECGDWKWMSYDDLPTSKKNWATYEEEFCANAGITRDNIEKRFRCSTLKHYKENLNHKIISPQEFYDKQGITPQMIEQINRYFENGKSTNK